MAKRSKKKTERVSDRLKLAIEESPLSRNQICLAAGIEPAAMSRFMAGTVGLNTTSVDALCKFLELRLVDRKGQ